MIDPNAYVARAREIAARELDGGVVVVTLAKQNIHFLNESAVELWPLIDGTRTVRDLAAALLDRFEGATEEQAVADVVEFVEELERQGVVHVTHSRSEGA